MLSYRETEIEPSILKQMFYLAFGCYPVLEWHENWTLTRYEDGDDLEEPVVLRDFHLLIDTERLDKINDFGYSYVSHLLKGVVEDKLRRPAIKHTNISASKKYSFSDTEDWWDSITYAGDMQDRTRFDVAVTIG